MSPSGSLYYNDGDHITPEGASRAAEAIAHFLWPDDSGQSGIAVKVTE
jgi:hypothetical protein